MLCVLDTGIATAEQNMNRDAILLNELEKDPILHLYDWTHPSVTYGHFIVPEKHLNLRAVNKFQLSLARRPTGGGIVFHIWDLAFSFLMPSSHPLFSLNTLDNYRFVNSVVIDVMKNLLSLTDPVQLIQESAPSLGEDCQHFCMARPTQYDVVYQGVKIAGAAQRRTRKGYLHQGTISLAFPSVDLLQEVLLAKEEVVRAMLGFTFAPLGRLEDQNALVKMRNEIRALLTKAFEVALR